MHDSRQGRTTRRWGWGRRIPAALLPGLLVIGQGCGGALNSTADYAGAASTIKSVLGATDSTYTLSGYVWIDREDYQVSVQAGAAAPGGGHYQSYAGALLTLAATSSSTTARSNNRGYFEFSGLPEDVAEYTLTIATSGGGQVQFSVDLAKSSITPIVS
jgi:hypothetical protein